LLRRSDGPHPLNDSTRRSVGPFFFSPPTPFTSFLNSLAPLGGSLFPFSRSQIKCNTCRAFPGSSPSPPQLRDPPFGVAVCTVIFFCGSQTCCSLDLTSDPRFAVPSPFITPKSEVSSRSPVPPSETAFSPQTAFFPRFSPCSNFFLCAFSFGQVSDRSPFSSQISFLAPVSAPPVIPWPTFPLFIFPVHYVASETPFLSLMNSCSPRAATVPRAF